MKKIIQTYKRPNQWKNSPPGIGDFIRGTCSLHELLKNRTDVQLLIDVSSTDFQNWITPDSNVFHTGDPVKISDAEEFFTDHKRVLTRISEFLDSEESELYLTTNLGDWDRRSLPPESARFAQSLYSFTPSAEKSVRETVGFEHYEVLSIRAGDRFFADAEQQHSSAELITLFRILQEKIIPVSHAPIVVTSDSYSLKCLLAEKYGFAMLPHRSVHGAFEADQQMEPIVRDLILLKNASVLYHINLWASWWSGFSHYTSLLFSIPAYNYCAPHFTENKISFTESGTGMESKTVRELHFNKKGKVSDKWESYLDYYDSLFAHLKDMPISLLEIGVQNGGSLETWLAYFENCRAVAGCDIDPKCASLSYDDPRIHVIIGDAVSLEAMQKIVAVSSDYDIIIDDGSHISNDVVNAFVNYFPMIKPGGIYVIEDTHTLYSDAFGGGILNEFGAYAFFKKIADMVSYQFWQNQLAVTTYFRTFFAPQAIPSFIADGWIESVEFRNSIITIRKSKIPGHSKLGRRVLVGDTADVQTWDGTFESALYRNSSALDQR